MRFLLGLMLMLALVEPAQASETLEIGPEPAWVKPVATATGAIEAEGNITYLLVDQQMDFRPGRTSNFTRSIFRIETAEGLASGNVSLAWQPNNERIIVHRLLIHRGGQSIDILRSGQEFTILRRESNLESAMLDGVLTANIQPEGLQIGDIIELATTTISNDPTFGTHVELLTDAAYSVPVRRLHFSAQWPASVDMALRQTNGLPSLRPRREGDMFKAELAVDGLAPPIATKGSPARFQRPRTIELSDFRSWSSLAALFAPLYDKASTLPAGTALSAEIERIRASTSDPRARAEAALALVQSQVRYVALLMGSGNFVPADAATTWNRRFGDCKGKSALLVAMLRALDISAEPVIVDTDDGDGLDERLPMAGLFNHVIVRATIGGKVYWLDGTRTGDRRLDQLETPDYGWGLPLAAGARLVRMQPGEAMLPNLESNLRVDASGGTDNPAPAHTEDLFRGDSAYGMSISFADMTAEQRDRSLREYWRKRYPSIAAIAASQHYDTERRELRLIMDGTATMDWSGGVYWLVTSDLGDARTDFERAPNEDHSLPYRTRHPFYARTVETILLPPNVVADDPDVELIAGGIHYRRKGTLTGNVFTVETSTRSIASEFPAKEAPAAQRAIRELARNNVALRIEAPQEAVADPLASAPKTANDYIRRGSALLDRSDWDGAVAALDAAVKLDPSSADALAIRGFAHSWRGQYDAADHDLTAAAVIEPDNYHVLRGRGFLAYEQENYADALRFFGRALAEQPEDVPVRGWRAFVFFRLRNYEAALQDAQQTTKLTPKWSDMYVLRASIYHRLGQPDRAMAEASALTALKPNNADARGQASSIYRRLGKREEAMREIDRAIELEPSPAYYLNRMDLRDWGDVTGRLVDVDAALRLDPKNEEALRTKATLQRRNGDLAGAIATLSNAIRRTPKDSDLLSMRGQAYYLADRKQEAERDFAAARAVAKEAADFNNICWNKAIADIDLPSALADCDAAVAAEPDNYMQVDSRAFVLLKLGRIDEAIAGFDDALARKPDLAESRIGRAFAWSRKGNGQKAEADRAAAVAIDPDIVEIYRFYGLSFDADAATRTD